jgi:uncharacterized protein (TIGR03083 family)
VRLPDVATALEAAYTSLTDVVADLDDLELLLPSGCRGWTICDLLLHVSLDAQRALVAFAVPVDGPADVDFVSYWRSFAGVGDASAASAHAQWVRRTAAAFNQPSGVVQRWTETSAAAVSVAHRADPGSFIGTQEHVLAVPDFTATLVTEAVIHHLDLIVSLPDAPEPPPEAIEIALSTLDGLAAPVGLPAHWSEHETLLKGTGREELTAADRSAVEGLTFPLLG